MRGVRGGALQGAPANATHSLAEALRAATATGGAQGAEIAAVARTSFVDAFGSTLWVAVGVALVASALVAWLLRPSATAKADAMVEEQARAEVSSEVG